MTTINPLFEKLEEDKYNFAEMKPEDFEKSKIYF
jgi:hypothetical protein